ncbi:MAG TPA: aldo/keto reductase [Actinokineospora sp.]|nr:aldo/keto reductase [Actinokineospora sp.]
MRHARLGDTAVEVTELSLGTAAIGNLFTPVDHADAIGTVDTAWRAGIRAFDTAPHYGLGLAERRLGAALRERPRAEYVVSTKVGRLLAAVPGWRRLRLDGLLPEHVPLPLGSG